MPSQAKIAVNKRSKAIIIERWGKVEWLGEQLFAAFDIIEFQFKPKFYHQTQ